MDFYKARKTARRIRHERTLLFIYALAVTAAWLISMHNDNTVKASIPDDVEISELAPEEFSEDGYVSIDDNLKLTEDIGVAETPAIFDSGLMDTPPADELLTVNDIQTNQESVTIEKGDSFIGVLTKLGLSYSEATDIYTVMKKVYDARNLKIGQTIDITTKFDSKYNELTSVEKVVIEPISGTRYVVEKNADGKYESRKEQDDLKTEVKIITGVINGNVSSAMRNAGVPVNVIGNFINIFGFSVDFRRDVRSGDEFEVRYERQLAPDGSVVKTGDIVYAALKLRNDKIELYRYKDKSGVVDYYDENGIALKKSLDRKPMAFKKARISSRFGRRLHPILKTYRQHHGVDYAAPMGTKVYASADGVVTMSKWYGGYGNFISIRHNSEYTTGYGHLKSFAKGIRPGVRVKQGQVIAYVGNTGRSTGPHLHFEVIKNGKKVDPLKVKAATGENLKGQKLADFKKVVSQIKENSQEEKAVADSSANDEIGQVIDSLEAE